MGCVQPLAKLSGSTVRRFSRLAIHSGARRLLPGTSLSSGLAIGGTALAQKELAAAHGALPGVIAEDRQQPLPQESTSRNASELLVPAGGAGKLLLHPGLRTSCMNERSRRAGPQLRTRTAGELRGVLAVFVPTAGCRMPVPNPVFLSRVPQADKSRWGATAGPPEPVH